MNPADLQSPDYKHLSTIELCAIIGRALEELNERVSDPKEREDIAAVVLACRLDRGSEPFWMQDIRLAQRHIQTAREASRSSAAQPE